MKSLKLQLTTTMIMLTLLPSILSAQNTRHELISPTNQINWTGFYGGLNIGGIFNNVSLHSNHFGLTDQTGTCNKRLNFSNFFPGVQVGYLRQFQSNAMLGVEGDFTYNGDKTGKLNCKCPPDLNITDNYSVKNRMQGSVRARLGYFVKPEILPFVSAGISFSDLGLRYSNEGGDYYAKNTTQAGWLVGTGFEWGFSTSWSVRAEYYYADYNSIDMKIPKIYNLYDANGNTHARLNTNNIRLVFNHWF